MATSRTCGLRAQPRRDLRRVADEAQAAALAVGKVQAARDGVIDLLAGRHPEPGDDALARQHAAFGCGERVGRVAALVLEEMAQILVAGDPEQMIAAAKAGRELKVGEVGAAVLARLARRASSVPWRDRCGRCRRDAAPAAPLSPSGNSRRRRAAWRYAAARRRSSRAPARGARQRGAAARRQAAWRGRAPSARGGTVRRRAAGSTTAPRRGGAAPRRPRRCRCDSGRARWWKTHRA